MEKTDHVQDVSAIHDEVPQLVTKEGLNTVKSFLVLWEWRREENRDWKALQVQGVGVDHFRSPRQMNLAILPSG